MKMTQPQLLVGLEEKLARVSEHWAAVDDTLPPAHPLVLLSGVDWKGFQELAEALPELRTRVRLAELRSGLARAAYERHKGQVHEWVRSIKYWVQRLLRGTDWASVALRVPGVGQSYQHWWEAARDALALWEEMEENPPETPVNWPMAFRPDCTAGHFAEVVRAFETAYWAISPAETKLKLARAALWRAEREAAALLMAYGHGVQARLGQQCELVRTIPQLWPRHQARTQK